MPWKGEFIVLKCREIEYLELRDLMSSEGIPLVDTVVLKHKGKVVAVCSVEILEHSDVVMCSHEEIRHAMVVRKVRRPKLFQRYFGDSFNREPMILKEDYGNWSFVW